MQFICTKMNLLKIQQEREKFNAEFPNIVRDLIESSEFQDMEITNKWLEKVLTYNVKNGKKNRAFTFIYTFNSLSDILSEEEKRISYVLGWCVEILQAAALIADDIMDNSETRRGNLCWYKVDNLNAVAFNDALFLESCAYFLLKKHLKGKENYETVFDLFHEISHKTLYGQNLDTLTAKNKDFESYTMELYTSIVKYKTSYYSFYLPIFLAFAMTGMKDLEILKKTANLTLKIGLLFQIQDDYLDCFGNVETSGKIGSDIGDGKCTWLFVTAYENGNEEEKKILIQNYGSKDEIKISNVKKLYEKLQIPKLFSNYEDDAFKNLFNQIDYLGDKFPKEIFYEMLHKIYRREK